jgi:hypothetical protein
MVKTGVAHFDFRRGPFWQAAKRGGLIQWPDALRIVWAPYVGNLTEPVCTPTVVSHRGKAERRMPCPDFISITMSTDNDWQRTGGVACVAMRQKHALTRFATRRAFSTAGFAPLPGIPSSVLKYPMASAPCLLSGGK